MQANETLEKHSRVPRLEELVPNDRDERAIHPFEIPPEDPSGAHCLGARRETDVVVSRIGPYCFVLPPKVRATLSLEEQGKLQMVTSLSLSALLIFAPRICEYCGCVRGRRER